MIAIVDYGMGNLRSVQKGFERVGGAARITSRPEDVRQADKIVLPGVGAFRDAMVHLGERGLIEPVVEAVRAGKPFLGICLGLQLIFETSYEDGQWRGLGLVPGEVVRFDFADLPNRRSLKVPHMGWNQVRWEKSCPLLAGLESGEYFYFVHSYYAHPTNPADTLGVCDYGYPFTAMIWRENVFACQFHPEKSQARGLEILRNFERLRA